MVDVVCRSFLVVVVLFSFPALVCAGQHSFALSTSYYLDMSYNVNVRYPSDGSSWHSLGFSFSVLPARFRRPFCFVAVSDVACSSFEPEDDAMCAVVG